MKRVFRRWLLPVTFLASTSLGAAGGVASAQSVPKMSLAGHWQSVTEQAPDKMAIAEILQDADGRLRGWIKGPDQSHPAFSIDAIEQTGTDVRIVVGEASGRFEGVLSSDGNELRGVWVELAIATPLRLIRSPKLHSASQP